MTETEQAENDIREELADLSPSVTTRMEHILYQVAIKKQVALTAANKRVEELEKQLAEAKEAVLDALKTNQYRLGFEILADRSQKELRDSKWSIREQAAKICEDKYVAYSPEHEFARVAQLCATAIRQMEI